LKRLLSKIPATYNGKISATIPNFGNRATQNARSTSDTDMPSQIEKWRSELWAKNDFQKTDKYRKIMLFCSWNVFEDMCRMGLCVGL